MPNSIVHFEIPADDVIRAKTFYERVFGWTISDPWKMDYFLVETKQKGQEGINGGLMQRKMPGQPFMNYVNVPSIDAMCISVQDAGGFIAMPKMEIGQGMGWIAAFTDPEGNLIGLHEAGPNSPPPQTAPEPAPASQPAKRVARKKPAKKAVKKVVKKVAKKPAKKTAKKAAKKPASKAKKAKKGKKK
jgi:predicted enzyme related to lactoylglutathione lyase